MTFNIEIARSIAACRDVLDGLLKASSHQGERQQKHVDEALNAFTDMGAPMLALAHESARRRPVVVSNVRPLRVDRRTCDPWSAI